MRNLNYLYHEDSECCHGEGHSHEDGECCHGEGHGHGHCHDGEGREHGHCHDGEEHGHGEGRGHGHCHDHDDLPDNVTGNETLSEEEKVALLSYMIRHNGHHLEELHTLAGDVGGSAGVFLNDAVQLLAQSNERLVKAFYALQAEQAKAADDDRA